MILRTGFAEEHPANAWSIPVATSSATGAGHRQALPAVGNAFTVLNCRFGPAALGRPGRPVRHLYGPQGHHQAVGHELPSGHDDR